MECDKLKKEYEEKIRIRDQLNEALALKVAFKNFNNHTLGKSHKKSKHQNSLQNINLVSKKGLLRKIESFWPLRRLKMKS